MPSPAAHKPGISTPSKTLVKSLLKFADEELIGHRNIHEHDEPRRRHRNIHQDDEPRRGHRTVHQDFEPRRDHRNVREDYEGRYMVEGGEPSLHHMPSRVGGLGLPWDDARCSSTRIVGSILCEPTPQGPWAGQQFGGNTYAYYMKKFRQ
ncbi:hypothetical protein HAX54_045573 [Datura stramonium]|uniref:Uncharacterized protein n=1 Tax=Datura stramonium TaxID=4076 RepID=A0ABS8SQN8_DATST|nr:hypothetical protein [Datura stramonium]